MTDCHPQSHISRILTHPSVLQNPVTFFEVYEVPVRKFFTCLCRNIHEADEQFQNFAVKFLSGAFDKYTPAKGRFRDYLKRSLRNQVKRSARKGAKFAVPIPEDLDAADPSSWEPIENALREFDVIEGEQIKRLVEEDMRADEEDRLNQFHSILQFAVGYQQQRLNEFARDGGRIKVPVSAVVDFIRERFGEVVNSDNAKQRMFRAKVAYASKMIAEIGLRITDQSIDSIREAGRELGLLVYIEGELARREGSRE